MSDPIRPGPFDAPMGSAGVLLALDERDVIIRVPFATHEEAAQVHAAIARYMEKNRGIQIGPLVLANARERKPPNVTSH